MDFMRCMEDEISVDEYLNLVLGKVKSRAGRPQKASELPYKMDICFDETKPNYRPVRVPVVQEVEYHVVGFKKVNPKQYEPKRVINGSKYDETFTEYIARMGFKERTRLMKEALALYQDKYNPMCVPVLRLWVDFMREHPEMFYHFGEECVRYMCEYSS